MLPALPEVLFYDDEKDRQVYEDEEKPIFKINVIKKFLDTKISRYTDDYFKKSFKLFFESFPAELKKINEVIFYKPPVPPIEEPVYIIDDLEDEETIRAILESEEYDEDELSIHPGSLLGWLWKIRRAWKLLKRAWQGFKGLLRMLGRGFGKLKNLLKAGWTRLKGFSKKAWTKIKRFSKKAWTKFLKWYRKSFKPFMKRMKTKFIKFVKRTFRKLKVITKRVMRKLKRYFFKLVKKFGKMILKKLLKKFGKKVVKMVISSVIKLIAGAFTATGVGAVIGVALFVAFTAWEVYDLTQDVAETSEAPDFEEQGGKQNPQQTPPPEDLILPNFANLKVTDVTKEHIEKYNQSIKDKVTTTLFNSKSQPLQIMGRLYDFYKLTNNWLLKKQDFVFSLFDTIVDKTNETLTKLSDFAESKYDIDFTRKRLNVQKELKKPRRSSWNDIMVVQKIIENGGSPNFFVRSYYGVKVNKKSETRDIKTPNNIKKERKLMRDAITGKVDIDIATLDPKAAMINPNERMSREQQLRKVKIGTLGVKNHLLYELYCRLAWVKENAPTGT